MPNNDDALEPSPAELGDTITVAPGEWTPLDDEGTQIYLYGDRPVTLATQTAEVADEARRLRAEVERLHEQLNGRARNEARLVNAFEALTTDANGRDLDATEALVVGKVRRVFAEATTVTRPKPGIVVCGAVNPITHSVCELAPHPAGTEHSGPDPVNGRCTWTVPDEAKGDAAPNPSGGSR